MGPSSNKGGSWYSRAGYCRSALRFSDPIDSQDDNLGFRLAEEFEDIVSRGGSWHSNAVLCRIAFRAMPGINDRGNTMGFRLSEVPYND